MPVCTGCGEDKPIEEFPPHKSRKSGIQSRCRPCYAVYQRDYYRNRVASDPEYATHKKELRKESNRRLRPKRRQNVWEYLLAHPCVDCGESDPIVLEFDHQKDKEFNISSKMTAISWDRLLEEIAKCEVVCSNCHKRRTAKQFGWYASIEK